MASELTFKATENLRKQILSRNLDGNALGLVDPNFTPTGTLLTNGGGTEFPGQIVISSFRDFGVVDLPTALDIGEFFLDQLYLANKYGPVGGFDDLTEINTIILSTTNLGLYTDSFTPPGGNGITSHNSVAKCYSPGQILLGVTAEGLLSDPALIDDSLLQQVGAIQLKKEFEYRIGQELEQQTIGRLNFLEGFKDPFQAADILSGRDSLIERDFHITMPKSLIGKGLDFVSRLTGVYLPFSYIPGDYFEIEEPRGLGTVGKIVSDITGILGSLIGIPRRRQSPSDRFLEYTGGGQKSQLFKAIRYNKYGPQYGEGAQAQTAIGAVFGEVIDFVGGGILGVGNYPPNPPQYVGSNRSKIVDMTSPPDNTYAGENYVPVYGPDEVAKDFDDTDYRFGLNGKAYANKGTVPGGFSWFGTKGDQLPGTSQGPGGSTDGTTVYTDQEIPPQFNDTKSTNYGMREGSILEVTQQIVESVPKSAKRLKHVGHAISQVSKVFNDGYKELTKGSRVRRFENTDPTDGNGVEIGKEYCRVWTKDVPYWTYGRLQKTEMNIRKETYSVLDSPFNLNIAPWRTDESGTGSSNIVDGKVKKYMFSLENLAWRTSREKGLTYDDLPACEKGSNGGRVMWFPPYDLQVDEASNANWTTNNFIGRPEPIYSYNNTDRTGTLRFKVVVDHPSILNMLVRKELNKLTDEEVNAIVDSFFAGCKKYDIYDLARKWNIRADIITEIETILNSPTPPTEEDVQEIVTTTNDEVPQEETTEYDIGLLTSYESPQLQFFFENDFPDPDTTRTTSTSPFNILADTYYSTTTQGIYQAQQPNETQKGRLNVFFDEATNNCCGEGTRFHDFMVELNNAVKDGKNIVKLSFIGGASNLAPAAYNINLSQRRLDSVKQMMKNYSIAGETPFGDYIDSGDIILPAGSALGEGLCPDDVPDTTSNVNSIYNASACDCRYVAISGIDVEAKAPDEKEPVYVPPVVDTFVRADRPDPTPVTLKKPTKITNTRREIAINLLQNMVTECDYFDILKKDNPFIYDSLKDKFKYFQPAFHAITPEGLNSRLTFLNQCVRPGATIPTKLPTGELDTNTDAKNTSFGAPPVCVLRIGDFYHTKIVIQQLSISYDENLFDINPEGIGVQPMIASVNLTFNYIGGQGLKGPVERLQNALSFNYYGNTEMYDKRAVFTVTDEDPDEQAWLEANQDLIGQIGEDLDDVAADEENTDTSSQDGQTIGDRVDVTQTASGETGFIKYKQVFNEYAIKSADYLQATSRELEAVMTTRNYGLLQVLMAERKFTTGTYTISTGTGASTDQGGTLLGQPSLVADKINTMFDDYETQVKAHNTYIQRKHELIFPTNGRKRKLKNLLLDKLDEARYQVLTEIDGAGTNLADIQIGLTPYISKLNVVNTQGCDGYIENGKITTLSLSGLVTTHSSSVVPQQIVQPTETMQELGNDYKYLINVMEYYVGALNGTNGVTCSINELPCENASSSLHPEESGDLTKTGKYVSPTQFEVAPNGGTLIAEDMAMEYLIFSNEIITKDIIDTQSTENFYYYQDVFGLDQGKNGSLWDEIYDKLGMTYDEEWFINARKDLTLAFVKNEDYYLKNLQAIKEQIVNRFVTDSGTITDGLNTTTDSLETSFVSEDKERKMYYVKDIPGVGACETNLQKLSSEVNTPDDTFNFKFNRI
tara:strand:+ start:6760 stop:11784 length:5025 start_codon:yes stop_codon:yes gene_type:complete